MVGNAKNTPIYLHVLTDGEDEATTGVGLRDLLTTLTQLRDDIEVELERPCARTSRERVVLRGTMQTLNRVLGDRR